MNAPDLDPVLAEGIEAAAWCDLSEAAGAAARVRRFGKIVAHALVLAPRARPLNGLLDVRDEDLHEIDGALAFLDALGVDYNVSVRAGTRAERALLERSFAPGYAWMKFGVDLRTTTLEESPQSEVEIRVARPDEGPVFGSVLAAGFGLPAEVGVLGATLPGRPGWTCFLASHHGESVGTGALFVSDGVAWLGAGATRPEKRRLGAQGHLLAARLAAAREQGCRVAFTETGERVEGLPSASYRNILRAGFQELYLRPNLVRGG